MTVVPVTSYVQLVVDPSGAATPIGIQAPTETGADPATLTITVKTLPENGVVSLDGNAVSVGQNLSINDLTSLTFTPEGYNQTYDFIYTVTDANGQNVDGVASLRITGGAESPFLSTPNVIVSPGQVTALGLQAPVNSESAASSTIIVESLPSAGVITLANGIAVTAAEELTTDQLTGLLFQPSAGTRNVSDTFTYDVFNNPVGSGTGTVTLSIGATSLNVSSSEVLVTASAPTALGISSPSDQNYAASALIITVTSLPGNGVVTLADGATSVADGQTLDVDQLMGLMFTPGAQGDNTTSAFTYTVADPAGNVGSGTVTLAVSFTDNLVVASQTVSVAEDVQTALGLPAPSDPAYNASDLTITVDELPGNGTVILADGTAVSVGQTLSVAQLTSLLFTPTSGVFNVSDAFTYSVSDPAENTGNGTVTFNIGGAIGNPIVSSPDLTVAEYAGPTAIGIQAPSDPNYSAPALVITVVSLPSDGTVTLADGTPIASGEALTVDQLTALRFAPTSGQFGQTSSLTYTVADPAGNSSVGTTTLTIGPSLDVDPVTHATLPPIDPGLDGTFAITDVGSQRSGGNDGTGPSQFIWPGTSSIAIRSNAPNVVIQGGDASDAIQVTSGSNVLDGGGGSNFLVGTESGTDQFFVDASGPGVTWNTLVNFHQGDSVTIWGFQQGVSSDSWTASAGAPGYAGATLNFAMGGAGSGISASLTFTGVTQQVATTFTVSAGAEDGRNYLQLRYN